MESYWKPQCDGGTVQKILQSQCDKKVVIAVTQDPCKPVTCPVYVPVIKFNEETKKQYEMAKAGWNKVFPKLISITGELRKQLDDWSECVEGCEKTAQDMKLSQRRKLCAPSGDGAPTADAEKYKELLATAKKMDWLAKSIDEHWCGLMEYLGEAWMHIKLQRESAEICWMQVDPGCQPEPCKPAGERDGNEPSGGKTSTADAGDAQNAKARKGK